MAFHPLVRNVREDYDVYCGRPSREDLRKDPGLETRHWGNPFSHQDTKGPIETIKVGSVAEAVQAFIDWMNGDAWEWVEPTRRRIMRSNVMSLRGKRLACFCKGRYDDCHCNVLARYANREVNKD